MFLTNSFHSLTKRFWGIVPAFSVAFSGIGLSAFAQKGDPIYMQVNASLARLEEAGYFYQLSANSQDIVLQAMKDLGLTETEISEILALEKANLSSPLGVMRRFPPNPKVGDTYTHSFRVSKGTIIQGGGTVAKIIATLVAHGTPAPIAIPIATFISSLLADNVAFAGVKITIKYVYGTTNDGVLGWNVGPTSWELYY